MDSSRTSHYKRQGFRQPLDRRVDKWIETGRQVVDGVAGNRPGPRRVNSMRTSSSSFEKVGRWVGDKLDWFLEDEDDWLESWQTESKTSSSSGGKRPLDAISRRVPKASALPHEDLQENLEVDSWPEDSSFRVEKWQRGQINENIDSGKLPNSRPETRDPERRRLPKSSRRR